MGFVTLWFVGVVLLSTFSGFNATCTFTERKLLNGIEKFLNQRQFELAKGIIVTRKVDHVQRGFNASCDQTRMLEINRKLRQLLNNHVLTFDLASFFSDGKLPNLCNLS